MNLRTVVTEGHLMYVNSKIYVQLVVEDHLMYKKQIFYSNLYRNIYKYQYV
jgi:hypothetical protein